MGKERKTSAASIHQRLLHKSRTTGEPFDSLLTRFALERLLYRMSISPFVDEFLLKGALLFVLWAGQPYRPTRDLDLLGSGDPDLDRLTDAFRKICSVPFDDDSLQFDPSTVAARRIREDQLYEGIRVELLATLGKARINIQIDVGFGDAVTPAPQKITFPVLLDHPAPEIQAYPKETVVAEKLEALVTLGIGNSRMKDFFDLFVLAQQFPFDGPLLTRAVASTFARRGTSVPDSSPVAFTEAFAKDPAKQTQWTSFLRKRARESAVPGELLEVTMVISAFLWPVVQSVAARKGLPTRWPPGGPWLPV